MSAGRPSLVIVGAGPRGTGVLERIAANLPELYGDSGSQGAQGSVGSGSFGAPRVSTSISSTPIRRAAGASGARSSRRCCG